ncbi:MAG: helix-turn-helix domain-containing protein [Gammaproteobacteria bacterium]
MLKLEKSDLNRQFAVRLRDALLAKGYDSARSPTGINMQKFADLTGHSLQICRKYLRGQVIPESTKLIEIATHLEVSPGWLLFGDCHGQEHGQTNKITINKELLHYIYVHVSGLLEPQQDQAKFCSQFFMSLTQDVSNISDDLEQSKKIIDLAIATAQKAQNKNDAFT